MSCSVNICISNTGTYDDQYSIDGLYNSLDYYTGATNGYYIFSQKWLNYHLKKSNILSIIVSLSLVGIRPLL